MDNTTGSNNTANGLKAPFSNTGSNNTAAGVGAGSSLTTGDNNIDIGNSGVDGESDTICIGSEFQKVSATGSQQTSAANRPEQSVKHPANNTA